ncbi:MAG: hypothetical protein Q4D23_06510 [Bacteroidales bacterium]|nr:hypothetical protein [Bacteroidales bacterium]
MKKLFILATMALCASSLFAQNDGGLKMALEAGAGTEVELGARGQYQLNKYLAWDVLGAKYAYDYNKHGDFNEFTLETGLRGFTPTFGPGIKAFAAIDLGYGIMWRDGNTSCFAMDFTTGIYVTRNIYMGYGLGLLHKDGGNHKDHLFRIGFEF